MFPTKSQILATLPAFLQIPLRYWLSFLIRRLEPELSLLRDLLISGDLALDIGANHGIYSYKLRRLGCRVHAFEPNSACSDLLIRWGLSDPNLFVHSTALGDFNGSVELQIPIDSHGLEHDSSSSIRPHSFERSRSLKVPIKTLDSFSLSNISFIKIDVEGAEYGVIKGALFTLKKSWPALLVEIELRHSAESFSDTFNLLHHLGYQCFFFFDHSLLPFSQFDLSIHQCVENIGITSRNYINNFLFLHSSRFHTNTYAKFLHRWA